MKLIDENVLCRRCVRQRQHNARCWYNERPLFINIIVSNEISCRKNVLIDGAWYYDNIQNIGRTVKAVIYNNNNNNMHLPTYEIQIPGHVIDY